MVSIYTNPIAEDNSLKEQLLEVWSANRKGRGLILVNPESIIKAVKLGFICPKELSFEQKVAFDSNYEFWIKIFDSSIGN